jgi:hypothetical protein
MSPDLSKLLDVGHLRASLDAACRSLPAHQVMIGVVHAGRSALVEQRGTVPIAMEEMTTSLPVGCIAKLLTSLLVLHLVDVDAPVALSLPSNTVPHAFDVLMEHRHGLDPTTAASLPRLSNGRIDMAALIGCLLACPRLNTWGDIYNYSNIGFWLASGLLEQRFDRPYSELLNAHVLGGSTMPRPSAPADRACEPICPASGRGLDLSPYAMLGLIGTGLRRLGCEARDASGRLNRTVDLPGWHATEKGIALGWKYYGGGWYGHDSIVPASPMALRINPRCDIGLFVRTTGIAAAPMLGRLCRDVFPELLPSSIPRPMPSGAISISPGTYGNSSLRLHIERGEAGNFRLRIEPRATDCRTFGAPSFVPVVAALLPAENRLYFLQPPQPGAFQFVQQVHGREGTDFLWNGRNVWPRIE